MRKLTIGAMLLVSCTVTPPVPPPPRDAATDAEVDLDAAISPILDAGPDKPCDQLNPGSIPCRGVASCPPETSLCFWVCEPVPNGMSFCAAKEKDAGGAP